MTYTISSNGTNTMVLTPDVAGFDNNSSAVTIYGISGSTSNFDMNLHDGIGITVNLQNSSGNNRLKVNNDGLTCYFAANISTHCSDYYIKHIAMKDKDGTAIMVYNPSVFPQTDFSFDVDVDVDLLEASDAPTTVMEYQIINSYTTFNIKTITITYGSQPREYDITYTNAVNGQNGVTNNNATTYNVTTNTFQITAPTRTGYHFDGFTYTDAQHSNPTTASLPMTIERGEAATRKAITFNASWTANTYTVTLDSQSATTHGTTSVTATYDARMPYITVPTKTNYTFGGYYTETNGGGTNGKEWKNYKAHTEFNSLVNGQGYLYANSGNVTLSFTGTPYKGDGVVNLTYSTTNPDATMHGWNLIGNPFSTNATIGDTPFYRMNPAGSEIIAADVNDNTVYAMEGIFVKATQANQTVTFETAMTRGNANSNSAALVMNISQNRGNVIDRAIVRFGEGQTLPKFQIHENSTKIYIPQDGTDYAIVSVGNTGEMPINFKAHENGEYTLTVSTTLNFQLSTTSTLLIT